MFGILHHLKMTYTQLLLYGIHVGHSLINSILYSAWLIYTYVKNITLITYIKLCIYDDQDLKVYLWHVGLVDLFDLLI